MEFLLFRATALQDER